MSSAHGEGEVRLGLRLDIVAAGGQETKFLFMGDWSPRYCRFLDIASRIAR